jgi:hypothetical protein
MTDPIVEEVRETRRKILARFDNDWKKYHAYLMEREKELRAQGVEFADDLKPKAKA